MNPDLASKADAYLSNYLGDLEYLISESSDEYGVNFSTSGTPYFNDLDEAQKYAADLKAFIKSLQESKS